MFHLPHVIGYQVVKLTTGAPTRGQTEVLSDAAAIRELMDLRQVQPGLWVMSAILEGDLDDLVPVHGPIRFIEE